MTKTIEERERVVVRFAGDSGDGMQLAGSRFTDATAVLGNDLATLPNFPAEIRAPAGTLAGVSAFQIHFASRDILTPGDAPNVLVAMNPAALKANLPELERGATIIVNEDAFTKRNLEKAGYSANPLEDASLSAYRLHRIPMTSLTTKAVEGIEDASTRDAGRAKNLFALGVLSWLYGRPTDVTKRWMRAEVRAQARRARGEPGGVQRRLVVRGDHRAARRAVPGQRLRPTCGRAPTATSTARRRWRSAWSPRACAAGCRCCLPATRSPPPPSCCTSCRATPASACARSRPRTRSPPPGWRSAPRLAAGSASPRTSGPGMDLKSETIGLAVALELPMIIVDVQRAGPSTGMPTKTEQSDLLMALYGRHGESPLPVIAPSTPGGCFDAAFEAVRVAVRYRTPVILLSDTFLASSSEPWQVPDVADLPAIDAGFAAARDGEDEPEFLPYGRDEDLARPWAIPGPRACSTASAVWRRPTAAATSPTTAPTTS